MWRLIWLKQVGGGFGVDGWFLVLADAGCFMKNLSVQIAGRSTFNFSVESIESDPIDLFESEPWCGAVARAL